MKNGLTPLGSVEDAMRQHLDNQDRHVDDLKRVQLVSDGWCPEGISKISIALSRDERQQLLHF